MLKKMYYYSVYLFYFLFIISLIGFKLNPFYLFIVNEGLKIYVSLFLIYRFNPYKTITFNAFDKEIIFSAGVFLLLSTSITYYLTNKGLKSMYLLNQNQLLMI